MSKNMIHDRPSVISPYRCPHVENSRCDCDRHITIAAVVGNPSRVAIESSAARIRARWTPEDELDRRASGRPVEVSLATFVVPSEAQHVVENAASMYLPRFRKHRGLKPLPTS